VLIGVSVLGLCLAWQIGGKIGIGDMQSLIYAVMAFAACAVAVATHHNWRTGFYLLLVWLLFKDLPRKFLGNNTALFLRRGFDTGGASLNWIAHT
jgi:hypothetical protein